MYRNPAAICIVYCVCVVFIMCYTPAHSVQETGCKEENASRLHWRTPIDQANVSRVMYVHTIQLAKYRRLYQILEIISRIFFFIQEIESRKLSDP